MMEIGVLCYQRPDGRMLEELATFAADMFEAKTKRIADTCYVNPAALDAPLTIARPQGPLRVVPSKLILPDHYYAGVEARGQKEAA